MHVFESDWSMFGIPTSSVDLQAMGSSSGHAVSAWMHADAAHERARITRITETGGMTERHAQIADFVRTFTGDNGYSPSFKEIAVHLGVKSQATIHKHVQAMQELGIVRTAGHRRVRSIEVVYASKPDCANCELLKQDLEEALATIERMLKRRALHG